MEVAWFSLVGSYIWWNYSKVPVGGPRGCAGSAAIGHLRVCPNPLFYSRWVPPLPRGSFQPLKTRELSPFPSHFAGFLFPVLSPILFTLGILLQSPRQLALFLTPRRWRPGVLRVRKFLYVFVGHAERGRRRPLSERRDLIGQRAPSSFIEERVKHLPLCEPIFSPNLKTSIEEKNRASRENSHSPCFFYACHLKVPVLSCAWIMA